MTSREEIINSLLSMDCVLPYSPDPDLDPEDGSCQIAGRMSILEDEDNGN